MATPKRVHNPATTEPDTDVLRIVFLATEWSSGQGGVSTFNRELACAVARVEGVQVWCLLPRRPPAEDVRQATKAGVQLRYAHDCPAPDDNDIFLLVGPMHAVDEADAASDPFQERVDAVIGHGRWTGPAAYRLAQVHEVSARVHIVHVNPVAIEPFKEENSSRMASSGDRVDDRGQLEHELVSGPGVIPCAVGPRLCAYLRNGEDIPGAHELLPGLSAQAIGAEGMARRVLFIGRAEDETLKGLDIAIPSLVKVATSERVTLEVRGARDVSWTERRIEELKRSAGGSGAGRLKATVTGFTVSVGHLERSYRNASLVIMPSREEGFGLVALEALDRGRPVVATRFSGFADLVRRVTLEAHEDLYDSFIFDPDDEGSLAEKVKAVFRDPAAARERASRLKSLLRPVCDWAQTARVLVAAITAERSGGGAPDAGPHVPSPSATLVAESEFPSSRPKISGLATWPRTIAGTWIDRSELGDLRDELSKEAGGPVLLLGGAGSGKSALLARLADDLAAEGWTVCAIKADQVPPETRSEAGLCQWAGLPGPTAAAALTRLVREADRRVVFIVDQLDALASLVDLRTARLLILMRMIRAAADVPGVRVVASMRDFESRYDPQLRRLRRDPDASRQPMEIRLGALPEHDVAGLWKKVVGATLDPVPVHLTEPRTLRLAVGIREPLDSARAVSERFWNERVLAASDEAKRSLFALAKKMDEEESFWVSGGGEKQAALRQFVGDGVLVELADGEGRYAFAHQTLHEEAQAYRWLRDHGPAALVDWVRGHLDTLTYRPKLRAILEHIRASEPVRHEALLDQLWELATNRLNLRELLAVHLAGEVPSPKDVRRMISVLEGEDGWVRGAALSALAGNAPWFDGLAPWIESKMAAGDAGWLRGYLGHAWPFAEARLDGWLSSWASCPERRADVLWVLSDRKTWTDRGERLLLRMVGQGADEETLGMVAYQMSGPPLVKLAARLAAHHWERASDEDPYEIPGHFPWQEAANADPLLFVEGLAPALAARAARAAEPRSGSRRFAYDPDLRRHLDPIGEDAVRAFADALSTVVRDTHGRSPVLSRLSAVDNEELQTMLARAFQALVGTATERVVDFLLADERRLLLARVLPDLLRALGALHPQLDDEQRERLLEGIVRTQRLQPEPDAEPETVERIAAENERYRTALSTLLETGEPADAAMAEYVDELDSRIRGGVVHSRFGLEELREWSDAQFDDAILYVSGRDWTRDAWADDGAVDANLEFCRELERWLPFEPERAMSLLDRLLSRAEEAHTVDAPDYRKAIVYLLIAAPKCSDVLVDAAVADFERALRAGMFEGDDEDAEEARWSAASTIVPSLVGRDGQLSEEVFDTMKRWAAVDAQDAEGLPEALEVASSLLDGMGIGIFPRGSFPSLHALAVLAFDGGLGDWPALVVAYSSLLGAADPRSWRTLLVLIRRDPGPAHRDAWLEFLDGLFERHPSVIAHPDAARILWNLRWIAPPSQMQRWLAVAGAAKWTSAARFAAELTTTMAGVDKQAAWAVPQLEGWLDSLSPTGEAPEDQVILGMAHGLAMLWSDETARSRAGGWVRRFVRHAPEEHILTMLSVVRSPAYRGTTDFLSVLEILRERGITFPVRQRSFLAEALLDATEFEPQRVAQSATWLGGQLDPAAGGASEPLMLVALHLTRQDDRDLQRRGMELFEMVLSKGSWHARRALDAVDRSLGRGR